MGNLRILLPCLCCIEYPYKIIGQGNEGIISKYGRFSRKVKPGMHYFNGMIGLNYSLY